MSDESQRVYFRKFFIAVLLRFAMVFENREPNFQELGRIVGDFEKVGFPGCIGCIDRMHIHWKNCLKSLKRQYRNPKDDRLATVSCEALVDRILYCWHWFSGRSGTNNDITVLDNRTLINDIISGNWRTALPEGYVFNNIGRSWLLYVLGDVIYGD